MNCKQIGVRYFYNGNWWFPSINVLPASICYQGRQKHIPCFDFIALLLLHQLINCTFPSLPWDAGGNSRVFEEKGKKSFLLKGALCEAECGLT